MNFARYIAGLIVLLGMTACSSMWTAPPNVTVNIYENETIKPEPVHFTSELALSKNASNLKGCNEFKIPDLIPLPQLPIITDVDLNTQGATDTILLDHIGALRKNSRVYKAALIKAYREHVATCIK